MNKYHRQGR